MPLDAGKPDPSAAEALEPEMLERLFGGVLVSDKTAARLCQAGLWLLAGHLDRCHEIAQSVGSADGSLWHAILHRREGDFSNSVHWYRRAGGHGIYPALLGEAAKFSAADPLIAAASSGASWDPERFIDACRSALAGRGDAHACLTVQHAEWTLLFDWCYRKATAES